MLELRGRPVSPGLARGKAYVIGGGRVAVPHYRIAASVTDEERHRLQSALRRGADDLARLQERVQAELGRPEAEIFDAHRALLNDEQFRKRICRYIEQQQVNAEWAVETTVKDIAASLESAETEYLRERAADVRDLGRRVLRHLSDDERRPLAYLPAGSILVARELFPLDLMEIDRAHLSAIVTERGGATGHAAILARALAIPAITGVGDAITVIPPESELLVDGGSGVVTVDPPAHEAEHFSLRAQRYDQGQSAAETEGGLVAETLDGAAIGLYANIGRAMEAQDALQHRLDGVGLFRTEYLFLGEAEAPTFEKHRAAYEDAARRLDGRPLVIRTLDLGGDKFPRFLESHHEVNPMLGLRGLRFSLTEGGALFETQVRAILAVAASHREVRILLPMVLGAADFGAARSIIEKLARDEHLRERPKIGAMIETPAAVLTIHDILELCGLRQHRNERPDTVHPCRGSQRLRCDRPPYRAASSRAQSYQAGRRCGRERGESGRCMRRSGGEPRCGRVADRPRDPTTQHEPARQRVGAPAHPNARQPRSRNARRAGAQVHGRRARPSEATVKLADGRATRPPWWALRRRTTSLF